MAAEIWTFSVSSLANGLKIALPTSTTVYYKIVLPSTLGGNNDRVDIDISSSCMESGNSLSISGNCNVSGAKAVTFAYDNMSVRIVEWSVG
jgi:hypothetical protein